MRTTSLNPDTVAPPIGGSSHAVRVETADAVRILEADGAVVPPDG
jgi:hypothetical protein